METPPGAWRLILSEPARGEWNMAVDEALLAQVAAGASAPVLRLYAWQPACLSLGQAQPAADADMRNLEREGWDLVRRPTGGRAILHTDELTYAVIAPLDEPRVRGTLLESYLNISRPLLRALELLGVAAVARDDPAASGAARSHNPVCFEEPSSYEIVIDGRKILGSAQARRPTAFLQHGALPLSGDLARITRALAFADADARHGAATRLLERAVTLEAALGHPVTWQQAAEAFKRGFQEALELELVPGALSPQEVDLAEKLRREKYASDSWTLRL